MTDREMLEFAAKAAGLKINAAEQKARDKLINPETAGLYIVHYSTNWNPLKHDGDAFRLMVELSLTVAVSAKHSDTMVGYPKGEDDSANIIEKHNNDPLAATCRAIVMAAAEIGRQME